MSMIVFAGPTLAAEEIERSGEFVCLPPVAQGDLYRAARARPRAIGVIDGYFAGAPSVWHKEILWALSEGVPVFGAASMGALRAAETHVFGMRGIGRIFEAFRDGALTDDDEVAVVHGPAELGYLATSEAMVNIRATLERAEAEGEIDAKTRRLLQDFAKSLYFTQRSWDALFEQAPALGVPPAQAEQLRAWLPSGRIDRKRLDALEMLGAMREPSTLPPPPVKFERTVFWEDFTRRSDDERAPAGVARVLDELRLEGAEAYAPVEARALARLAAERNSSAPAREDVQAALTALRGRLGLYTRASLDAWAEANGLDAAGLERLAAAEARLEQWRASARGALAPFLADELRASDAYQRLAERAGRKAASLAAPGRPAPVSVLALRLWFFEQRLGQPLPDDIEAAARTLGFADAAALDAALLAERAFAASSA